MFVLIIVLSFFCFPSFSSQPEGLILPPVAQSKGVRVLRNNHVTYSDEVDIFKIKFRVKGRSRPSRAGSVVSVIESGELVERVKDSQDGKWMAVLVRKNGLKVWLPSSALVKKKGKKKSYSSSESSEALSKEADSDE